MSRSKLAISFIEEPDVWEYISEEDGEGEEEYEFFQVGIAHTWP